MEIFTVTTAIDENDFGASESAPGGTGLSLREALRLADNIPGRDTIVFDPTIFAAGERPEISLTISERDNTDAVTLDISESVIIDGSNIPNVAIVVRDNNLDFFAQEDFTLENIVLAGTNDIFILVEGEITIIANDVGSAGIQSIPVDGFVFQNTPFDPDAVVFSPAPIEIETASNNDSQIDPTLPTLENDTRVIIGDLILSLGDTQGSEAANDSRIAIVSSGGFNNPPVAIAGGDNISPLAVEPQVILGTAESEALSGLSGDDVILGGLGDDSLNGGDGDDLLLGGLGDNVLNGDAGNDLLEGNSGDDTISGGADDDVIYGHGGGDILNGNAGNDVILGDSGNDTINGGADDDVILGGDGVNVLDGGAGNNLILGGADIDTVVASIGNDVIETNGGADNVAAGDGNNIVLAGDGNDVVTSGSGVDTLVGGSGNDNLSSGAGADTLVGGLGNDTLNGGEGADQIIAQFGSNVLNGEAGADFLLGAEGGDILNGGADGDVLNGLGGNDTINGGSGNDLLVGEAGNDTFVFSAGDDANTVVDFENDIDTLDFTSFGFANVNAALAVAFEFGGNVIFDLGGGDSATINATTLAELGDDILV